MRWRKLCRGVSRKAAIRDREYNDPSAINRSTIRSLARSAAGTLEAIIGCEWLSVRRAWSAGTLFLPKIARRRRMANTSATTLRPASHGSTDFARNSLTAWKLQHSDDK